MIAETYIKTSTDVAGHVRYQRRMHSGWRLTVKRDEVQFQFGQKPVASVFHRPEPYDDVGRRGTRAVANCFDDGRDYQQKCADGAGGMVNTPAL